MRDTIAIPEWIQQLPHWVRADETRWLTKRPWIAALIRDDDWSLEPAIQRFEYAQRRLQTAATQTTELLDVRGYQTTAMRTAPTAPQPVTRHVNITTPDATRCEGLALPFNELSVPVAVAGILCYEKFDRQSFPHLPTSCPMIDQHDYQLPPVGRVTELRHTTHGVQISADITNNRELWIRRWNRGEHSSLSVAFTAAPVHDAWSAVDGIPVRTPRGARLVDVAVVESPAYRTARIISAN